MNLSIVDQIWNRAALEFGGPAAREGDRALADLLLLHGVVMNGGIGHAIEVLSPNEWSAAINGYRFFGLESVALLLEDALVASEDELAVVDFSYGELIPMDQVLVDSFENFYSWTPEAFAPIDLNREDT